jgi:ribosomal protein S18 acetylase RimI-like enzyme
MTSIRKAIPNDDWAIATCFLLAMEDIIYKFIGEANPAKAREFMEHLVGRDDNQYSWKNCWVAEDAGKVVAAILLYDGALLTDLRQPVIEYLKSEFGRDFTPEDETQAGEYYIDSLGVNPDEQGKGIGTELLRFVIDEHVNKEGHTLGLLVDESNPKAKRLYVKLGFRRVGSRVVFGKTMEHLQLKG